MKLTKKPSNGRKKALGFLPFGYGLLFFSSSILALALVLYLTIAGPFGESRFVQENKYQAVFVDLNNGQGQPNQVYFGKITTVNNSYVRLRNIFYIQSSTTTGTDGKSTTQNTLKKLGCEVHGPQDEMMINREHVIFWENLKDDGQVVQKINEFNKQNPNGQKCEQPASQAPTTTPSQ